MVNFIALSIIGGLFCYYSMRKEDVFKRNVTIVLGVFASLCISTIIGTLIVTATPANIEYPEVDKVRLVSLIDSNEMTGNFSGSFFLASGSVSENDYYKFYYETSNGEKGFGKVYASDVTIFEEERDDAYMSTVQEELIYPEWVHTWFAPFPNTTSTRRDRVIHVPKGTIKVGGFNLDLK